MDESKEVHQGHSATIGKVDQQICKVPCVEVKDLDMRIKIKLIKLILERQFGLWLVRTEVVDIWHRVWIIRICATSWRFALRVAFFAIRVLDFIIVTTCVEDIILEDRTFLRLSINPSRIWLLLIRLTALLRAFLRISTLILNIVILTLIFTFVFITLTISPATVGFSVFPLLLPLFSLFLLLSGLPFFEGFLDIVSLEQMLITATIKKPPKNCYDNGFE